MLQPKGADRKHKTDREKMEKKPDKDKYQPSYECTVLKQVMDRTYNEIWSFHTSKKQVVLCLFCEVRKTQAILIDQYQDAHKLEAKTQAVGVKSTCEHLGSSHAWQWPIIDL